MMRSGWAVSARVASASESWPTWLLDRVVQVQQVVGSRDGIEGNRYQQMHPLSISRTPCIAEAEASWLSTATSPNSFLRTADLVSGICGTRLRIRVVFPEPKKPVTMVMRIGDWDDMLEIFLRDKTV